LDEALEEIAKATGTGDWSVEVDFEANLKQLDKYSQDHIGEIYYEQAIPNLAKNIKRNLESETIKEAFNEATSERKISIVVNDKQNGYWELTFKNGGLILSHKKSIANLSTIEYLELAKLIPVPGTLSLVAKLDIEKNREKLEEALQKIKEATGEDYSFDEASLEAIYPKLDKYNQERIGSTFYGDVLGNLAKNFERALKDDMVKEAFNEIATAHQVTVRCNPKLKGYWDIAFENGVVVVTFREIANISTIEYFNIEPLL